MAINEKLIVQEAAAGVDADPNIMLDLNAGDVDSYDGDGDVWYDIHDFEFKPTTNVSEHFNTVTFNSTGVTGASVAVGSVGFQPDLVWIKPTNYAHHHRLTDSVRGVDKSLRSNTTDAEQSSDSFSVLSFNSDGFNYRDYQESDEEFVAWCFNAGGNEVTNTEGTIDSTVRANNDLGFSIVKYEGNLTSGTTSTGQSVGHNLDVPPELIIFKSTSNSTSWDVFSSELDNWSTRLQLNSSGQKTTYILSILLLTLLVVYFTQIT